MSPPIWDIRVVSTWPPGAMMLYESKDLGGPRSRVGTVVANDGVDTITVLWDAGCVDRLVSYRVRTLNDWVIRRAA